MTLYRDPHYRPFEQACFAAARAVLHGAEVQDARSPRWTAVVSGTYAGLPAEVRLQHIVFKHGRGLHTYAKVLVPIEGVDVDVQPFDSREIGQGMLVDVRTGNPGFDEHFVVDGAPADAVRRILDAPTVARIVELTARCNPAWSADKVTLQVAPTGVTVSYANGLTDPRELSVLLETVAAIASRVGPIVASTYADPAAAERGRAELADLYARRRAKARRGLLSLLLVLAVVLAVIGAVVYAITLLP